MTKLRPETPEARNFAADTALEYNTTPPSQQEKRLAILKKLLGSVDEEGRLVIESPFQCDFGYNIYIGKNFFSNHNLQIHDHHEVRIGDNTMIGPNCTICTIGHPIHPRLRMEKPRYIAPVTIGSNVWIGANVVILPGVTIGDGAMIAANSMVNKDVPPMVVAGGTPCRVIREITDADYNIDFEES